MMDDLILFERNLCREKAVVEKWSVLWTISRQSRFVTKWAVEKWSVFEKWSVNLFYLFYDS